MVVIPHAKDIKITTLNFGKKCIGSTHNFFTTEILLMLGGRTKRIIKNIQNKKQCRLLFCLSMQESGNSWKIKVAHADHKEIISTVEQNIHWPPTGDFESVLTVTKIKSKQYVRKIAAIELTAEAGLPGCCGDSQGLWSGLRAKRGAILSYTCSIPLFI